MSIRLSEDEAWEFLAAGHTAILTTLRTDGWPVSLPIWFVVEGRVVYVATPSRAKKVRRVRADQRACLLVERGEAWVDLAAVELPVRASIVDAGPEADEALAAIDRKYATFRPTRTRLPDATGAHYSGQVVMRLDPVGPPLTWDNARIRLRPEPL